MGKSRLRVLSIFGTRPEAVKMAPVIARMNEEALIDLRVCVTAQHREMLDQVLNLFEIRPDYDLDLMRPDQSLSTLTAAIFTGLEPVMQEVAPDWVILQGDTTTVMAASLLAYYYRASVGHVEAGLRTGDKWQPFPEEINRRVVSTVADLHFAPTETSRANLLHEGVPAERIVITGNPVIDALQSVAARDYDFDNGPLAQVPWKRRVILVTAHRRENFGQPLIQMFTAMRRIAEVNAEDVHLLYPVHLNPNVRDPAHEILGDVPNISLVDPLDYLPMVQAMKHAYLVLTDSGGLQEEAPALGTPVLVMREVTERPEAVEAGTACLVGVDTNRIVSETQRLLDDRNAYARMARAVNPFGDGHAAERIVQALLDTSR
jgi:UDP-N-acetylglucosamine 2-epimerase (non-hydrolysing)